MKNIHEILGGIGLTVPEDKKADFDKAIGENYKTIAEFSKVQTVKDDLKTRLDTATETLKSFEGVDVGELQNKIKTLQTDLGNKETEFNQKLADMEFSSVVDTAISSLKAKNSKAVKALLDLDTLKQSENQADDIKTAHRAVTSSINTMLTE